MAAAKAEKAVAAQKKMDDLTAEYTALAKEMDNTDEVPTKIGVLRKAIATLKRARREAAKLEKVKDNKKSLAPVTQTAIEESELTAEAVETLEVSLEPDASEDEDDEEGDITLDESTPTIKIDGSKYYMTSAYGLAAVLFDEEGEVVGAYDESTGDIQELDFEE